MLSSNVYCKTSNINGFSIHITDLKCDSSPPIPMKKNCVILGGPCTWPTIQFKHGNKMILPVV